MPQGSASRTASTCTSAATSSRPNCRRRNSATCRSERAAVLRLCHRRVADGRRGRAVRSISELTEERPHTSLRTLLPLAAASSSCERTAGTRRSGCSCGCSDCVRSGGRLHRSDAPLKMRGAGLPHGFCMQEGSRPRRPHPSPAPRATSCELQPPPRKAIQELLRSPGGVLRRVHPAHWPRVLLHPYPRSSP